MEFSKKYCKKCGKEMTHTIKTRLKGHHVRTGNATYTVYHHYVCPSFKFPFALHNNYREIDSDVYIDILGNCSKYYFLQGVHPYPTITVEE